MVEIDEMSELLMPCSICNTNQSFIAISVESKMENNVMVSKSVMKLNCGHVLEMIARCYRPQDEIITL